MPATATMKETFLQHFNDTAHIPEASAVPVVVFDENFKAIKDNDTSSWHLYDKRQPFNIITSFAADETADQVKAAGIEFLADMMATRAENADAVHVPRLTQ